MISVREDYVQVLFEKKPTIYVCLGTDNRTLRLAPLTDEVREKVEIGSSPEQGVDFVQLIDLDLPTIDLTFNNIKSLDVVIEGLEMLKDRMLKEAEVVLQELAKEQSS